MMAVNRVQAGRRSWGDARRQHGERALFHPSSAPILPLRDVEDAFFEVACEDLGFTPVELVPVVPAGTGALTGIDPNNVLGALRGTEVLADPTAAMGLHIAHTHVSSTTSAALATSARLVRMQPLPPIPGYSPHFRIFALTDTCTSRDDERRAFERHVVTWLALLEELAARGYATTTVRVEVTHAVVARGAGGFPAPERAWVEEALFPSLRARFPRVAFIVDEARTQAGWYYDGLMLQVRVRDRDGNDVPLGDGGPVGWLGAMTGDRRRRLMTSGFGGELVAKRFLADDAPAVVDDKTSLRPATRDDAAELARVLAEPKVAARWTGYDRAAVDAWLADPGVEVFAILRAGAVVGGIQAWQVTDPEYPHAGLDLFVSSWVERLGVALAAIRLLSARLFAKGHHRLVIDPARDNIAARRTYARAGFRTVGRLRGYERGPNGSFHDGVLMDLVSSTP
jgi:aminoglycoside 6'-N-acetyltransferase